jgi:hypothetical protein
MKCNHCNSEENIKEYNFAYDLIFTGKEVLDHAVVIYLCSDCALKLYIYIVSTIATEDRAKTASVADRCRVGLIVLQYLNSLYGKRGNDTQLVLVDEVRDGETPIEPGEVFKITMPEWKQPSDTPSQRCSPDEFPKKPKRPKNVLIREGSNKQRPVKGDE